LSYGQFLALFLVLPLAVGLVLVWPRMSRIHYVTLAAVSGVALIYTAPWDNLIVVNGVWSYSRAQILGVVLGHVPLEEYVFYVLQVFLTGICTVWLLRRMAS